MAEATRHLRNRITSKGRTTVPKAVRDSLGLKEGDELAFLPEPDGGRFYLVGAEQPAVVDDPFAAVEEWASDADTRGYAGL